MEHSQELLAEEHPELSEGDLVKIALKKWRSLDCNEKGDWNEQAERVNEGCEDKKRKREHEENDQSQTAKTQKPVNHFKKLKADSVSPSARLAGFAFNKS